MKKLVIFAFFIVAFLTADSIIAQGTAFTLKSGLSLNTQRWTGLGSRSILLKPHYLLSIESLDLEDKNSFFLQAGYHQRGTAFRFGRGVNPGTGVAFGSTSRNVEFHNISLSAGVKTKKQLKENLKSTVFFGLRGEYTANTKFEIYEPLEGGTRKMNWGVDAGMGLEWMFAEHMGAVVEFRISPDVSRQIFVPAYNGLVNPYTGDTYSTQEQNIRNVSFELSVGLRFLRRVVYYE